MKKKLAAVICAFALALALPMAAYAAPSPATQTDTVSGSNGTSLTVSGTATNITGLTVTATSTAASNVPAGVTPTASFEVKFADATKNLDGTLTFNFSMGAANAGRAATVYIQHGDGATETKTGTVAADGTLPITVDKLSVYSVVLGEKTGAATDTTATSPKTGVDFGAAAAVAGVAVIGAGVAFAARRKLSE